MNNVSKFKTAAGRRRYLEAYDAMMALWSTPHESRRVETSFGVTHLHIAGAYNLPPLLMLHGFGLSRAAILGHSYGGWIASSLAMVAPQRVDKLVLLSPAASFVPFASSFFVHAGAAYLLPGRTTTEWFLQWMTTMPIRGHALVDQVVLGFKHFRMRHGVPTLFSDDQWSRLKTPALLLMGEHDRHYSIKRVEQRARQAVSGIQVEVIQGGGHLFPLDRAEETNARILSFLTASST